MDVSGVEISFSNVVVFVRPRPLPCVSTTLPCVSLKAKISKDTLVGLWLEDELDEDDEILVDELLELLLEELELLDELLLEELLLELLLDLDELDELEELLDLEELDDELIELLLDVEVFVVLVDVATLDEETLLDELLPFILEKSQALTHIAISINALIKILFFFIKNLSQLLNNKITIIAMVNSHIYHDYFTLFLASATVVARLNVVLTFILVH